MKTLLKLDSEYRFIIEPVNRIVFKKKYKPGTVFQGNIKQYKKVRSIPELHLFIIVMYFMQHNTPEIVLKQFDVKYIDKDAWSMLCKLNQGVDSISFDNMPETDFNNFFQTTIKWLCSKFLHCDPLTLVDQAKEFYFNVKE